MLEHFEQIRALILGMDQKMKLHDEKLQGMMVTARAEEKRYEGFVSSSTAALAASSK